MKNKTLLTAGIIAAFGLAVMTSSTVFVQDAQASDGTTSIIQKIAQKFNLKEADVKAVFEQERQTRMADMETRYITHLTNLVSDGKITGAQKSLILAKHKEMVASKQSNEPTKRTDLKAWAKENGIDLKYLMPFKGMGHGMGPKPD